MVLRGAQHSEAARDFVDFLLAPEVQTLLARLYGETPVNPGVEFPPVRPLRTIKRLDATLEQALERLPSTHEMMRVRGFEILVDPEVRTAAAVS